MINISLQDNYKDKYKINDNYKDNYKTNYKNILSFIFIIINQKPYTDNKSLLPKSLKTISNSKSQRKCTTYKRQEINLKINDMHFIFVVVINTLMKNKLSYHLV